MTRGLRALRPRGGAPLLLATLLLLAAACEREQRRFVESPPSATPTGQLLTVSQLQPGPAYITADVEAPYDDNAWAVSQGQTLFTSMNCVGCHFHGGGGIGPALMDDQWIYGSAPEQIFASIAEGRPNGMPAWKYKLSDQQIWMLVSYVRSLSGLIPKGARPGRSDHMMLTTPPTSTAPAHPKMTTVP
ncbi:MAG TPA: c-type cytochrome [Gemmatimonadaceae bacterium]|nr:c-type cytochrome [Gemmatimonadaceae bacterium]